MKALSQGMSLRRGKPVHVFCLVALVAYLISAAQDWLVIQARAAIGGVHVAMDHHLAGYLIWQSFTTLVVSAVQLGGLALIAELIDQVRWLALSQQERDESRSRYVLARLQGTGSPKV